MDTKRGGKNSQFWSRSLFGTELDLDPSSLIPSLQKTFSLSSKMVTGPSFTDFTNIMA
jgi:hypothetical protein